MTVFVAAATLSVTGKLRTAPDVMEILSTFTVSKPAAVTISVNVPGGRFEKRNSP
jgi:hypothetical protein